MIRDSLSLESFGSKLGGWPGRLSFSAKKHCQEPIAKMHRAHILSHLY